MSEPTPFKICVGKNVQNARKAAGYTQQQLADMLGIKKGRISRLETGKTMVVAILLYYISETLNTPIDKFFIGLPGSVENQKNSNRIADDTVAPTAIVKENTDLYENIHDNELNLLIGRLSENDRLFFKDTLFRYMKTRRF